MSRVGLISVWILPHEHMLQFWTKPALEIPQPVEPFKVDKTSFGNACAWMVIDDIEAVKE